MQSFTVIASALNIRQEPSTEADVIGMLNRGDMVTSVGSSPNGYWQKVEQEGKTGWVSFKYLQPTMAGTQLSPFPWFDIAKKELGVAELHGPRDNPRIVEYLRSTSLRGDMASNDETPWCSAFVNFCIEQSGFAGTDSAMARSWLKWGRSTDKPLTGCIAVFKRGEPPSGHVAFFVADYGNNISVLGGNQGDKVSIAQYPASNLLGYRVP